MHVKDPGAARVCIMGFYGTFVTKEDLFEECVFQVYVAVTCRYILERWI